MRIERQCFNMHFDEHYATTIGSEAGMFLGSPTNVGSDYI